MRKLVRHLPLSAVEVIRMRHSDPCLLQSLDSSWNKMQQTEVLHWIYHLTGCYVILKLYLKTLLSILLLHCTFFPLKSSGCGRGKFADKKEPLNEKKVELIQDIIYAPACLSDLNEDSISRRISWRRASYKERVKRKFRRKKKINRRKSCRRSCMSYF